ncbi:MAG: hypothetical protein RMM58_12345 [Chloroflexota bacterium]|nr:hypothetical protein [Dehalococcoidia bacterium]MDW8254658.1 hypothetical protein [Chloroflexota bacterium]
MSKLIEKLRAAARGVPPRIGFAVGGPKPKAPGIGLLAALGEQTHLGKAVAPLVDALIIDASAATAEEIAEIGAVVGINAGNRAAQLPDLKALGADFVVIGLGADAVALRMEEGAKVLRLPLDTPDGSLRAISVLPVDVVLVEETVGKRLSVDELLNYLRLGALSARPLIVTVDADFAPDQLVSLRDASVAAVCVPVTSEDDIAIVEAFRHTIDSFPAPPRRDRGLDRSLPLVSIPPAPSAPPPRETPQPETVPAPIPDDD